jgi:hypothetical protein
MSRRRKGGDSSLELLLDTICNTFGGVLFLAMLVSLLLQMSRTRAAVAPPDLPPSPALTKAEVVRLSTEARELAEQLKLTWAELSRVRSLAARFADAGAVEGLEKLHSEQSRQRALEVRRAQLLAAIAADKTAAASVAAAAHASRNTSRVAASEAEIAVRRLQQAEQRHKALAKTALILKDKVEKQNVVQSVGNAPRERETHNREFGVLLRYGRAYLTHFHRGMDRVVNTRDFTVKPGLGVNTATAKPGAGLDVCAADADASLRQLLSNYPAADWYPCVIVYPDSYDAFQVLKSKLVNAGYEYRVVPTNKAVGDHGGAGRVQ